MRLIAHSYQVRAAQFLADNPGSMLLADPGTGKTAITLMVLGELIKSGQIDLPVLLVAPLRVVLGVWGQEINKWDQFSGLKYQILHGKTRDVPTTADIHITNFASLPPMHHRGMLGKYRAWWVDESSKVKNPKSEIFQLLKQFIPTASRRHCMTGSPTPRSLLDIFSQIYFSAGPVALGDNFYKFRRRYFYNRADLLAKWVDHQMGAGSRRLTEHEIIQAFRSAYPDTKVAEDMIRRYYRQKYMARRLQGQCVWPDWQPNPGAEEAIYSRVAPWCYRLDAQKVLDMPALIVHDIPVIIPPAFLKISTETAGLFMADPLGHRNNYLISRRAASGIGPEGVLHRAKIEAFGDLLEELGGKHALVFFVYRTEGAVLSEMYHAPKIDGDTRPEEAASAIEAWNRGDLPLLFLQSASCGHGLNLQAGGNDVIYYTLTDNYDDYDQGFRRVYRQGVTGSVRVHRLVAIKTIDEAVRDSLDIDKGQGQKAFLDTLERICHASNM
jgi:SNF2 family DNA or RNA helicase